MPEAAAGTADWAMSGGAHHAISRSPGEHYVHGYTRRDGIYVQGHYQTNANATRRDNWSTVGKINPYTGQPGTKPGDPATP